MIKRILPLLLFTAASATEAGAAPSVRPELVPKILHVDPRSKDSFATIQSALDAAGPGDIIKIAGGVYFEHVQVNKGGTEGAPLTLQAEANQTVLINAGTRLEAPLKAVPGLPGVFAASVSGLTAMKGEWGIWEMPSRLRLATVSSREQASARVGSVYYDEEEGRLYIRGSGLAPADQLDFWIESPKSALTVKASHVILRGLQATLGQNGFLFEGKNLDHVTVEDCRAFCNSWAGIHVTGDDHLIAHNETFDNNTYGIQLRYGVNRNRIADNLCYRNGPNNGQFTPGTSVPADLSLYSVGDFNVFEGNVVENEIHEYAFRNKTGHGPSPNNVFRRNVVKGNATVGPFGVYGNTFLLRDIGMRAGMYMNGGNPSPSRKWEKVDPNGQQRRENLFYPLVRDEDPRFADPAWRDYRLQADSPYLGAGAHPGIAPVYYVDPVHGSDQNSGLSLAQALATIPRALSRLPAGGTLYLLPGKYTEPAEVTTGGFDLAHPLRIRAYGRQPGVALAGGLSISKNQFVELEGLEFPSSRLNVKDSSHVSLKEIVFTGAEAGVTAEGSRELTIDHCAFQNSDAALRLSESPNPALTNSVFEGCKAVWELDHAGGLHADFNGYSRFAAKLGGSALDCLKAWQEKTGQDARSQETAIALSSEFATPEALSRAASDFGFIGARSLPATAHIKIANLRVAGLSPHGASLLWDSPAQPTFARVTLKKGGREIRSWEPSFVFQVTAPSFDCIGIEAAFFSSARHAGVSRLEPDTDYSAIVTPLDRMGNQGEPMTVSFRTPGKYAEPVTYYISASGNDKNDGRSKKAPWKSFAHAMPAVGPGDEVVLLPGRYTEAILPVISGTPERKIRIRSEKPREAILDQQGRPGTAVAITDADHIEVDGLFITGLDDLKSSAFSVNHAGAVTIRNCETDYVKGATPEKLKTGGGAVIADAAPDLRVENNQFLSAMYGTVASRSPGTVVLGNTFVGEGNYGVVIIAGGKDESYTVENNLFWRATLGYKVNPCVWVFEPRPNLECDYNLYGIPEGKKGTIGRLPGDPAGRFPLSDWQNASGLDAHSVQAIPVFADPATRDYSLMPGSPGAAAARDGGVVGRRK